MRKIATICARGGSQGVPGKNIRLLFGKPLIAFTIEQALSCPGIDGVYVSTDSPQIAEIARAAGAEVPFLRPAHLATSTAPKVPVIKHLIDYLSDHGECFDAIVDLDPTSPLRNISDIRACIEMLDAATDVVITGYESDKNPYFNMVEVQQDGSARLVKSPQTPVTGRQSAPKVYSMNASIYVWHKDTLDAGLWNGRTKLYVMPRERSVDIDSELDFRMVELLMKEKIERNER